MEFRATSFTSGPDVLHGTRRGDTFNADGGRDTFYGHGGRDSFYIYEVRDPCGAIGGSGGDWFYIDVSSGARCCKADRVRTS